MLYRLSCSCGRSFIKSGKSTGDERWLVTDQHCSSDLTVIRRVRAKFIVRKVRRWFVLFYLEAPIYGEGCRSASKTDLFVALIFILVFFFTVGLFVIPSGRISLQFIVGEWSFRHDVSCRSSNDRYLESSMDTVKCWMYSFNMTK